MYLNISLHLLVLIILRALRSHFNQQKDDLTLHLAKTMIHDVYFKALVEKSYYYLYR